MAQFRKIKIVDSHGSVLCNDGKWREKPRHGNAPQCAKLYHQPWRAWTRANKEATGFPARPEFVFIDEYTSGQCS